MLILLLAGCDNSSSLTIDKSDLRCKVYKTEDTTFAGRYGGTVTYVKVTQKCQFFHSYTVDKDEYDHDQLLNKELQ